MEVNDEERKGEKEGDEKIEAKRKVRRDDISAVFENDPSDGLKFISL